jgi:hypothetical protein
MTLLVRQDEHSALRVGENAECRAANGRDVHSAWCPVFVAWLRNHRTRPLAAPLRSEDPVSLLGWEPRTAGVARPRTGLPNLGLTIPPSLLLRADGVIQ